MMGENQHGDRNHKQECQLCMVNGGKMDKYIEGCNENNMRSWNTKCSKPENFAVASKDVMKIYH